MLLVPLVLAGCPSSEMVLVTGTVTESVGDAPLPGAEVRAGGQVTTSNAAGEFRVEMPAEAGFVRVKSDGWCPASVQVTPSAGEVVDMALEPLVSLAADQIGVGFDQEVVIRAETNCDDGAHVDWTQVSGPPLGGRIRQEDGGRRLRFRTHDIDELEPLGDSVGALPVGRRSRLDYRFRVSTTAAGGSFEATARVVGAASQTGGYQVSTGAPVYVNGGSVHGHRWSLRTKPGSSEASVIGADKRVAHFIPDVAGTYTISHQPSGKDLLFVAYPLDEVPRDCGDCHEEDVTSFESTAHANTFRRGITGELGADFSEQCWACHATGPNGGFDVGGVTRVAEETSWVPTSPAPEAWAAVPEEVRESGAIGCASCHGAGRQLPGEFHWEYDAKFTAGICATCHDVTNDPDANHVSGHFQQWLASEMASPTESDSGDDPGTRAECVGCHTTQGFISALAGIRSDPESFEVTGVTCVACHDPHGSVHPAGLRTYGRSEVAQAPANNLGAGAICTECHRAGRPTRDVQDRAPHAPQSNVLLGRGSFLVPQPRVRGEHSDLADSCVSCHMAESTQGTTGGHTFSVRDLASTRTVVSSEACSECHGTDIPPQAIGGIRDFDGDGRSDNLRREFDRAFGVQRARVRTRIRGLNIRGRCDGRRFAGDFVEHERRLVLVDETGQLLGDCDNSGRFDGREQSVTIDRLAPKLRRAIWDLSMLAQDGSQGRHNPSFSFEVLRAVRREL